MKKYRIEIMGEVEEPYYPLSMMADTLEKIIKLMRDHEKRQDQDILYPFIFSQQSVSLDPDDYFQISIMEIEI